MQQKIILLHLLFLHKEATHYANRHKRCNFHLFPVHPKPVPIELCMRAYAHSLLSFILSPRAKVSPPFTTAFELSVCPFVALHHKRPNSPPPSLHNVWCVIPPLKTTVHKIFVQRTGPVCPKSFIFHPFLNHFESTTLLHAGPEQKPRQIYIY